MKALQNKRIFFVEDDGKNLAIIFSILENNGAIVKFAPWKFSVDTMQKFAPIDIILLDMMLPGGMSGFDIYEDLRKVPELKDVPVAAVTALESAEAMNKARQLGFKGYILKPIRMNTFPDYITTILEGGEVWGGINDEDNEEED